MSNSTEESEEKLVKLSIYLTEEKRARFKSACALSKRSMNEALVGFIDKFLEENEAKGDLPARNGNKAIIKGRQDG